jgi:beta-galactosidase
MARLWAWEAFAHGAEVVSYFRWRQAPFAQEQMHAGLLRPDSAPAPALAEVRQVADEIAELGELAPAQAPVALVFDYESAWAWETQPQGRDFDYFRLTFAAYRALRSHGLSVDILPPSTRDFSNYRLVLIPGLMTLDDRLQSALGTAGGEVILGPRTNSKTRDFAIPVSPMPPAIPGLDCTAALVESLPPGTSHPLARGGAILHWLERLEGRAEVVEATADGRPVLMRAANRLYLGGWPDDAAFARIVGEACARLGVATEQLPEGLRLRDTATHRFAINYGPEPASFAGRTIGPADVAWWPR